MSSSMTLNVRVGGLLGEFVASRTGTDGAYENVSEYIRDLIRRDKARADEEAFERLRVELQRSFAAPDDSYRDMTADDVIGSATRHRSA